MAIKSNVISRLLSSLNNSVEQQKNNALYQVVKSLIKTLKDLNSEVSEQGNSIEEIISTITPSPTVQDLDGTNDPGISNTYSRGDHKHDYGINSIDYDRIQEISAASKLLGRGTAGGNNVREISLGTNLSMSGDTLNASSGVTIDYVLASDGATPTPNPLNDGFGNFIYVPYSP